MVIAPSLLRRYPDFSAQDPFIRSGRTAGHLVEPWPAVPREHFAQLVEGSVACARVGTKVSAAGLFLLVGGSLTRELERGSAARVPDGAWVKAASAGCGSTRPSNRLGRCGHSA